MVVVAAAAVVTGHHQALIPTLTTSSPRLAGNPVSSSMTSRTPSGGFLCKSRTSRAKRASVRGGKFSPLEDVLLLYCRYRAAELMVCFRVDKVTG